MSDAAPKTGPLRAITGSVPVPRNDNRVIWLLLAAAFVAILNETTMGVAIPHLITDLHITAVAAQWLTTAFMLTMAVVIPISGFLLQRLGTRMVFIAAMTLFSAGTLIALLSPGFELLVVARVVQASGTAIMMPLLMTTIMTVVPPHGRGQMMGRVSIVMALAPAIGPTMSGFVLDTLGWRWIFGIVLPIALVSLFVGARWMHDVGKQRNVRIDVLSVILSALGFGGLVFGLSQIGGAEDAGGSAADAAAAEAMATVMLWVALGVGVVALALFIWRQLVLQREDRALLDLRVFGYGNFSLSVAHFAVLSLAFFGTITVLPLYMQNSVGMTALEAGLVVLPGSLAMGLAGPIIGRIYDVWGTRVLLVPGSILTVALLWLFTSLSESTPVWELLIVQTALSIGLAMSFTPLFTASLGSLPPHLYSYGSAIVSTVQQVAGAAGIAVMITIVNAGYLGAEAAGATEAAAWAAGSRFSFLFAAVVAIPTILGAFLIRKPADAVDAPMPH